MMTWVIRGDVFVSTKRNLVSQTPSRWAISHCALPSPRSPWQCYTYFVRNKTINRRSIVIGSIRSKSNSKRLKKNCGLDIQLWSGLWLSATVTPFLPYLDMEEDAHTLLAVLLVRVTGWRKEIYFDHYLSRFTRWITINDLVSDALCRFKHLPNVLPLYFHTTNQHTMMLLSSLIIVIYLAIGII